VRPLLSDPVQLQVLPWSAERAAKTLLSFDQVSTSEPFGATEMFGN